MAEEKEKKEVAGPVVVRGGHVRPPLPGAKLEIPQEERLAPPAPASPREKGDDRPQWQRVADEQRHGAPSQAPRGPGGGGGMRGSRPPGDRRFGRPSRPPREDRPRAAEKDSAPAAPALPPGEPPPAPEAFTPDEGSFAEMLAGSSSAPRRRFSVGEKVAGKIIQLGHDVAFLELGSGVAEGMIEVGELKDSEGNISAREGDIIDGVVVHASDRGVLVSRGHGHTSRDHAQEALAEAAHTGLPVEGIVKAVNKGGLEVEVHGARAFCPISQVDVRFVGDAASFVGKKLLFKVQRTDGRDAVLSRRALLEEERAEKAKATREKLVPGAIFEGTVTSVQDYGAFVDLGGLEGLVHVSELAWDRNSKPQDLLKSGDTVKVQILRIDEDPKKGERIALSVKALEPRPEPEATTPRPQRAAPPPPPKAGDLVEASVDKIETFGIFVRFPGGRGLVPAGETGTPRGSDLRKAFKPGDVFKALILAIDEQGRLRLSKTGAEAAAERAEAAEYMQSSSPKQSGKGFGTLGDLLRLKLENK